MGVSQFAQDHDSSGQAGQKDRGRVVRLREIKEKKMKAARPLRTAFIFHLPKGSLVFMPHQLSLFSVFVLSDFFAPLLDYAAHSVLPSR